MSAPVQRGSSPVEQKLPKETLEKWIEDNQEKLKDLTMRAFATQDPKVLEQYDRCIELVEYLKGMREKEAGPTETTPLLDPRARHEK